METEFHVFHDNSISKTKFYLSHIQGYGYG